MTTTWQQRYAQRMQQLGSSAIRELLKLTQEPDMISFAGGLPAPELFPVAEFSAAARRVLKDAGSQALQYGTTEGYLPLREFIVQKMSAYGIQASVDNVLITSGSQQALDLIGKLLINSGDLILTERPTYLGALQAWRAYQAEFTAVPIDDYGLRTDLLEEALCGGPKFMYLLPNFQNPGGVTLSLERRKKVIDIADQYGVPLIEDDPYGELRFEGTYLPPLITMDSERLNGRNGSGKGEESGFFRGNVIYLSTFSKTLAPGLRLGWMVAPRSVIQKCVQAKQGMDLHTSTFVQMVAYETIKGGFLQKHVRQIREVYKKRRDVMIGTMLRQFPSGITWTWPEGGLFLWVTLPDYLDTTQILEKAIAQKVAFVPGATFFPDGGGHNHFRLNFSNAQPEVVEEGIRRLGAVLAKEMNNIPARAPA